MLLRVKNVTLKAHLVSLTFVHPRESVPSHFLDVLTSTLKGYKKKKRISAHSCENEIERRPKKK